MRSLVCTCAALLAGLAGFGGRAAAEHDHHHHHHDAPHTPPARFGARVALVAAHFDNSGFAGDYQGVAPGLHFAGGRFAVGAALPFYRLQENGRVLYGLGDAALHGQATLARRGRLRGGATLMVTAPTGSRARMTSMGHAMVMPALWGSWERGAVRLAVNAGFCRALADLSHHAHGSFPLVDPMNLSEVSWGAGGELVLAPQLRAGARVGGAVPTGAGTTRVVAGARAVWTEGRVATTFEIQAGLAGDPFTFRGVLETAVSF